MTTLYNQLLSLYDSLHAPQRNIALHCLAKQVDDLHQKTQQTNNAQEALQEILTAYNYAQLASPQQRHLKSIATRLTLAQNIVDKLWPSQQHTTIQANSLFKALYNDILPDETKQYTTNLKKPVIATKKATHINFFIQAPREKNNGMCYLPFSQPPLFSNIIQREDIRLDILLHNINNNIKQHNTTTYTRPIINRAYLLSTITKTDDNTKREVHHTTTQHEQRHLKDYINSQGIIDFYSKEISATIHQDQGIKKATIHRDLQRTHKHFRNAKENPKYHDKLQELNSTYAHIQQIFTAFPSTMPTSLLHRYESNYVSTLLSITPHKYLCELQDI